MFRGQESGNKQRREKGSREASDNGYRWQTPKEILLIPCWSQRADCSNNLAYKHAQEESTILKESKNLGIPSIW